MRQAIFFENAAAALTETAAAANEQQLVIQSNRLNFQ